MLRVSGTYAGDAGNTLESVIFVEFGSRGLGSTWSHWHMDVWWHVGEGHIGMGVILTHWEDGYSHLAMAHWPSGKG